MNRLWLVSALFCVMASSAPAQNFGQNLKSLADDWDGLLKKHVRGDGGVDYRGFNQDFAKLKGWINRHRALNLDGTTDNQKLALYINLYNGTMVYNVLKYVRAEKIDLNSKKFLNLEINGISVSGGNIWSGNYIVNLAGTDVNLDHIEHGLIRGDQSAGDLDKYKVSKLDPRIHAAVNCAALSCPRVREKAYRTANVNLMLEENMKEWLGSEKQFSKKSSSKMKANKIVFWYYSDFDDHGKKVLKQKGAGDYLSTFVQNNAKDAGWKRQHLKEEFNNRSSFSLRLTSAFSFNYDWRINDIRNTVSKSH